MAIDLTSYQEQIKAFYTPEVQADLLTYSRELLVSEVGEVIGLRAKRRRGDARYQDAAAYRAAVIDEMGDALWALVSIATACEVHYFTFSDNGACDTSLEDIVDTMHCILNMENFESWLIRSLWHYVMGVKITENDIETIAARNIEKLQVRAANNLIRGDGHGEERR